VESLRTAELKARIAETATRTVRKEESTLKITARKAEEGIRMNTEEIGMVEEGTSAAGEAMGTTGEEARVAAVATKMAAPRADQDQEQANFVGQVQRLIQALQGDATLLALVAKRKVTPETLTAGLTLITTFNDKRALRQEAMGSLRAAGGTQAVAFGVAKLAVTDYRESVRLAYPGDKALQKSLGLSERVPKDQEKFMVYATTCATTAKKAPHAKALEDTGFEIAGYESKVSAFSTARASFLRAEIDAKSATAARDEAFKSLKTWVASLHRAIRLALKTRPDLLATLGL
jgi:hypothetical protein